MRPFHPSAGRAGPCGSRLELTRLGVAWCAAAVWSGRPRERRVHGGGKARRGTGREDSRHNDRPTVRGPAVEPAVEAHERDSGDDEQGHQQQAKTAAMASTCQPLKGAKNENSSVRSISSRDELVSATDCGEDADRRGAEPDQCPLTPVRRGSAGTLTPAGEMSTVKSRPGFTWPEGDFSGLKSVPGGLIGAARRWSDTDRVGVAAICGHNYRSHYASRGFATDADHDDDRGAARPLACFASARPVSDGSP